SADKGTVVDETETTGKFVYPLTITDGWLVCAVTEYPTLSVFAVIEYPVLSLLVATVTVGKLV
ncbi:hypothetical protein ACI3QN_13385, partial [Propionibacterium freudenreichii]|uniref:hypothetical protein n=1 Tax=Propionibacterium freudenreichii TaxID=1744 RepID=UPI0038545C1C